MHAPMSTTLQHIASGDTEFLTALADVPHGQLLEAAKGLHLMVSRESVGRVLRSLGHREITAEDARQWASFVRRGYFAPGRDPVAPLMIEYESSYEDAIVEVIARLDNIGDLVDGNVPTAVEIEEYLTMLGLSNPTPGV